MSLQSLVLPVFLVLCARTCGHVRFMHPVSRSSLWRLYGRDASADIRANYNDNQLFCGGAHVLARNGGRCGVCGDSFSDTHPRDNEVGGKYYSGFIPPESIFTEGQQVETYLEFTANHLGYVQFKVCPYPNQNPTREVSQSCLDNNILSIVQPDGSLWDQYEIPGSMTRGYITVQLPAGLTCQHCVFQFRYRGGNNWGRDLITGRQCLGCGDQEEFWGCADITIHPPDGSHHGPNNGGDPIIPHPIIEEPFFPEPPAVTLYPVITVTPEPQQPEFIIQSCVDPGGYIVPSIPCCYGKQPGDNNFCMSHGGRDCPPSHCWRRNDYCPPGEGTHVFCMAIGMWVGVLDRWCFEVCMRSLTMVPSMCFCLKLDF